MKGNLVEYIEKERKNDLKLRNFYENLRDCNTDLFLFNDSYVVALKDHERWTNKDGSIKYNEEDLTEIENVLGFSSMNDFYIKDGRLKPLKEILVLEYNGSRGFKEKGIKEILKQGWFLLPQNMGPSFADNYR